MAKQCSWHSIRLTSHESRANGSLSAKMVYLFNPLLLLPNDHLCNNIYINNNYNNNNSVAIVRERILPTELPKLVFVVSANFCG
jgi:hypothetical protein